MVSERIETWRELAADIRKRAECPLRHGEERITSGEAIGNLLLDIANRVQAVCERMEVSRDSVDASTLAFIGAQKAAVSAAERKDDNILEDLRALRNGAREDMRALTNKANPPEGLFGQTILVLLLSGIRFGITVSILIVKNRRKHPDGQLPFFETVLRKLKRHEGGAK